MEISLFLSKKLIPAKLNYSDFDNELLVVYLAFWHFLYFAEGRVFHINTEHKPLTFAQFKFQRHFKAFLHLTLVLTVLVSCWPLTSLQGLHLLVYLHRPVYLLA